MRLALVLVMVATVACVTGEPARRNRWPKHRDQKDQQIEELLSRVDKLDKELAELQAYVSKLHVKTALPPPPLDAGAPPPAPEVAPPHPPRAPVFAPTPPPGNLPQSGGATPSPPR